MSLARLLLTSLVLFSTATPALADGFVFRSGDGRSGDWPSYRERQYDPWRRFDRGDRYDRHDRHDRHRRGPSVVYVMPRPQIYSPPPTVLYAPPPVAYAPPLQAMPTAPAYADASGRYCREFQSQGVVNGGIVPMWGTACQQPDGSWQVVD